MIVVELAQEVRRPRLGTGTCGNCSPVWYLREMPPKKKAKLEEILPLPDLQWQIAVPDEPAWRPLSKEAHDFLETQFQSKVHSGRKVLPSHVTSAFGLGASGGYDFASMTVDDHSSVLPIRRLTKAAWEWKDDNGLFVPFYDNDTTLIERAWRHAPTFLGKAMPTATFQTTSLSFNVGFDSTYTFRFFAVNDHGVYTAIQRNEDSGRERELQRSSPEIASAVWDKAGYGISGMKIPPELTAEATATPHALKKEPSEVPLIASSIFDPPSHWEPQSQDVQLFEVSPKSSEFKEVLEPFRSTLFVKPTIFKLTRIQHTMLWRFYALTRFRVASRNDGDASERMLFHGARAKENMEAITNFGFDMRVARDGLAGIGIYFATNASYSNAGYVFCHPDGSKEMYICRVACGADTEGKHGMKRPPKRPGKGDANNLYDSVSRGKPKNMYVVFDNAQAYPEYIVHYKA